MAANLLIVSLENAFVNLITPVAAPFGANVYPGHSSKDKVLPAVIAAVDGSSLEEDPPHTGNFWADVEIAVKASAATEPGVPPDPNVFDQALVQAVFTLLLGPGGGTSNLDQLLNAQGQDLTVFPTAYFFLPPKAGRDQEGVWVDIQPIKVYCCASIIAP